MMMILIYKISFVLYFESNFFPSHDSTHILNLNTNNVFYKIHLKSTYNPLIINYVSELKLKLNRHKHKINPLPFYKVQKNCVDFFINLNERVQLPRLELCY